MPKIQQNQIEPGQCPINPETGLPECPPFDRIECIIVEKVYDSCFQIDNRTRETVTDFTPLGLAVGDAVECGLTAGLDISCTEVSRTPLGDGFSSITIMISVPVTLTNPEDNTETFDTTFNFTKTVTLCAPSEEVLINCDESATAIA